VPVSPVPKQLGWRRPSPRNSNWCPELRFERVLEPYYLFRDTGADWVLACPARGDPLMRSTEGRRSAGLDLVAAEEFDGGYCIGACGPDLAGPATGAILQVLRGMLRADLPPLAAIHPT
jgi:putative intracellular protease/amidase